MRGPRTSLVLILGVAGVLLFAGIAQAHSISFPTSLSIGRSPSGVVDRGTVVTFSGKLSSPKGACERHSKVSLIKVGTGVVATGTTGPNGAYAIHLKVNETARWRVEFAGKVLNAVHPHNHVCEASTGPTTLVVDVLGVTITPTKTPPGGVAFTGSTRVVPLGFVALLLLLLGSGMLWVSRRRGDHAAGNED